MAILLLIVIYVVFVSLGLPDGVFGSAWPAIHTSFGVPVGMGGVVTLVITLMGIISSLATTWLVQRLGVERLLLASTALAMGGLLGFSLAPAFYWLILLAVPLGLGAGAIDSALNHYVATHYRAHHMNWLHACWGIGASLGPIIFAYSLASSHDWRQGYTTLGLLLGVVVLVLILSLPLWRRVHAHRAIAGAKEMRARNVKFSMLLRDSRVRFSFLTFLLYVGIEVGIGLWLASYLVDIQGQAIGTAALWTGIYYGAITLGRVFTGFISFKASGKHLIRIGIVVALFGAALLVLNVAPLASLVGIVLIGLGFAPTYPGLLHLTPSRFGTHKSAKVISLQMVGASIGASIIPPLIGLAAGLMGMLAFALIMPLAVVCMLLSTEWINRLVRRAPRVY